jgi:hypothetical protein
MTTKKEPQLWRLMAILGGFLIFAGCSSGTDDWECAEDAAKFCSEEDKPARLASCLQTYKPQLSPACSERLNRDYAEIARNKWKAALGLTCRDDVVKHCADIAPHSPREDVANCLDAKGSAVDPTCRSKIRTIMHIRVGHDYDLACRNQIIELCDHISRNAQVPEISACLNEQRDRIPQTCRDMIDGKVLSNREIQVRDQQAKYARKKAEQERLDASAGGSEN